jgi:hypothetical protein
MLIYVIIVVVVEFFAVMLGLQLDKAWPSLGLAIALALFFWCARVGLAFGGVGHGAILSRETIVSLAQ